MWRFPYHFIPTDTIPRRPPKNCLPNSGNWKREKEAEKMLEGPAK